MGFEHKIKEAELKIQLLENQMDALRADIRNYKTEQAKAKGKIYCRNHGEGCDGYSTYCSSNAPENERYTPQW